jgi:long-chain fatty acid transport protein
MARRPRRPVAAAALAAALAAPAAARAQGLSAPGVGPSTSGPATLDPSAVHWNPGALGFTAEPTLLGGLGLIVGDVRYRRERRATYQRADSFDFALPVDPAAIDAAKTGRDAEARATPVAPLGSLFAALPLPVSGARLVAGLGLYVPYAALVSFDKSGPQRWAVQEALVSAAYVTPSIAWRPADDLSVGAGVSYVRGFAELSRVQDFAAVPEMGRALANPPVSQANDFGPNAPSGVRELDVMARRVVIKDAWANGVTFNAGAAWRPDARTVVGLSYQHSVKLNYNGRFQLDMNDSFFTGDLAAQGLRFKPRVEGDATLSFTLPRALRAGASRELGRATWLALALDYTFWSQVRSFDVRVRSPDLAQPALALGDTFRLSLPRRWMNTYGAELTLRHALDPQWQVWGVAGYHSPASPDSTIDVASPDGHRLVGAVGASYAVTPKLALLGDFKTQAIVPRRVTTSDHDLGNGLYNLRIFSLGGYLRLAFLPLARRPRRERQRGGPASLLLQRPLGTPQGRQVLGHVGERRPLVVEDLERRMVFAGVALHLQLARRRADQHHHAREALAQLPAVVLERPLELGIVAHRPVAQIDQQAQPATVELPQHLMDRRERGIELVEIDRRHRRARESQHVGRHRLPGENVRWRREKRGHQECIFAHGCEPTADAARQQRRHHKIAGAGRHRQERPPGFFRLCAAFIGNNGHAAVVPPQLARLP